MPTGQCSRCWRDRKNDLGRSDGRLPRPVQDRQPIKAVLNQDEDLVIVRCDLGGIGNGKIDLDEEIRVVSESEFGSELETSTTDWEVL